MPHGLPVVHCSPDILPDYLALYGGPAEYRKTPLTCVCFHEYDVGFDGQNGLWAAIYYGNKRQQEKYKKRFEGVRFFISPDYTLAGDVGDIENNHRLLRSRTVSVWLTTVVGAVVIPLVSFVNPETLDMGLEGLEECEVVAFSTKGSLRNPAERSLLTEGVRGATDRLTRLRLIVVYDACADDAVAEQVFSYAIGHGVEVVIPPNKLKRRNTVLRLRRQLGKGAGR